MTDYETQAHKNAKAYSPIMYEVLSENTESTVLSAYEPEQRKSSAYQSEAQLEDHMIKMLKGQGYEYLQLNSENDFIKNLRAQIEKLNNYTFSDSEWKRLFNEYIANKNDDSIQDKSYKIQEDNRYSLRLDNGQSKNISILDKKNIHNNYLQVINQYENGQPQGAKYNNRYDVTILVNGLPLVHIELKRRGVAIKEAFNQIERYQRDSFWAGYGLFNYVQIFVISNGTETKYYSNTTRWNHWKDQRSNKNKSKTSNSFEFTSYWADADNTIINDLVDFTSTFFARHTILNILTKYCVFTSTKQLMVMRPYQITAAERIINTIKVSSNYKKYGTIEGGGYVWHSTGSGKTLTSFKAARLASNMEDIDKVLFVVDRRDLDYQTMLEYDNFEKGAANSNTSTAVLKKQLEDSKCNIIITTIQKLSIFIEKNPKHKVFDKHVVLIFDECHRGHFGESHELVIKNFKKYHLFGFTGTPIFAENSSGNGLYGYVTTEAAFGPKLHTYSIVDAIRDQNVLPFRVDYIKTFEKKEQMDDEQVYDIDREKALLDHKRVSLVTSYILNNFNRKTYRNEKSYSFSSLKNIDEMVTAKKGKHIDELKEKTILSGFNSIFAVESIEAAKRYYYEFKSQLAEVSEPHKKLKIATIFSYGANEEEANGIIEEENPENPAKLDKNSRDFLEEAIADYNKMFGTSFDTSSAKFQNYYKDVSLRMKNKQLDLLIVVNMFLTGFDATTLNTLWVDKNLKMHGLIQAFSRTNRILNSVKTFGNIVCFRNLEKRINEAVSIFGDKDAGGIVVLRKFKDYYYGFTDDAGKHVAGYKEIVEKLLSEFPVGQRPVGEKAQAEFIRLFGGFLKLRNLMRAFDDFSGQEIITERDFQDYESIYQDLYDEVKIKRQKADQTDISDDLVFEIELIKTEEIGIDYILMLVAKYHEKNCQDKEIIAKIQRSVNSSPELRSKRNLIMSFIDKINEGDDVVEAWHAYVAERKEAELAELISSEGLNEDLARRFIKNCFRDGEVRTTGTEIGDMLPPMSMFGEEGKKRIALRAHVVDRIIEFFEKFKGIWQEN